ncbi:MAG: hypothetical protein DDT37_01680 [Firmicutes bacterium]|nr:hypothetical protein [candidate division NPL-UPA2 bacterium]
MTSFSVTKAPGRMPNSSPKAARTAGATWTTVCNVGSLRARQVGSVASASLSAATGQTLMHCPHATHGPSAKPWPKGVVTTALEPRPARPIAETFCTCSQMRMQRPQRMHLFGSRTTATLLKSCAWARSSCLKRILRTPSWCATSCSSHVPWRGHTKQSCGWLASKSSTMHLRVLRTISELVRTRIPEDAGYTHEAARLFMPSISTTHSLQEPSRRSSGWKQRVGTCTPALRAASSTVEPGSTSTGAPSIVSFMRSMLVLLSLTSAQ